MSIKKSKVLSLLIAVSMSVGIFAGCGGKDKVTDSTATSTNSTSSTSTNAGTEEQGYVPQKDLELTIWNTQGTDVQAAEFPKEDIPGDWLAKKTRVKVKELYGNGGQQWEAKLTTLVAGGNLPNLVLTQSGQGPAHHAKLHEGDLNWELTPEMLQKYAPDVWKSVPQYIWDSIKVDGKIYGIPFALPLSKEIDPTLSDDLLTAHTWPKEKITWSGTPSNPLIIRDDILKQLIPSAMNYEEAMALIKEKNAPIGDSFILPIKTTDEYTKFLYDIKALGLKEGNKPVYAFGYNGGDLWMSLCVLGAEMIGFKGYYYTSYLDIANKKMDFGYLNPVFKEAGAIQNKMLNDKVIDPESLMHNAEKFKEKVMNGQYAITWAGVVGGIDKVNADLEAAGKKFRFVPFFTQVPQKEGFPVYQEGPPSFNQALSLLKTIKEEDIPQVLNWINVRFTDEWDEIKYWGPKEAGLYEDLPDGKRRFKDEKLNKLLIEQDDTAMDWKDAKGFVNNLKFYGGSIGAWEGVQKFAGRNVSKFEYRTMNKMISYNTLQRAVKFPAESPWCQGFELVPNVQSWSPEYANIPEVIKLWATRATWDDPFKIAFTAKNEDEFSKKWDASIENLRKTIDVDKMLEEQTKIALPLLEKRAVKP